MAKDSRNQNKAIMDIITPKSLPLKKNLMAVDMNKLKAEIIKGGMAFPPTEHAIGFNKGIEHCLEIIERIENEK